MTNKNKTQQSFSAIKKMQKSRASACSICHTRPCGCSTADDELVEPECELDSCITDQIAADLATAVGELDIFTPSIDCSDIDGGVEIFVTKKDADGEIRVYTKTLLNGLDGNDGQDGADGNDGADGADGQNGADGISPDYEPFLCEQTNDGSIVVTVPGFAAKVIPAGIDGADGQDGQDGADGADGKDGIQGDTGNDGADGKDSLANLKCEDEANGDIKLTITDKDGIEDCKTIRQGVDGLDSKADVNCTETTEGFVLAITDIDGNTAQKLLEHGVDGEDGQDGEKGEDGQDGQDSLANVECEDITGGIELTLTNIDGQSTQKIIRDGVDGQDGNDGEDGNDGADGADGNDGADGICLANIECEPTDTGDYLITITDKDGETDAKLVRNGRDGNDGADGQDGQDGADGVSPTIVCTQLSDGSVSLSINGGPAKIVLKGGDGADGQDGQDGNDGADGQDGADGISPTIDCTGGEGYITFCIVNADGTKSLKTLTAPVGTGTGANGNDGADGADGVDGVDGVDGQDGADGSDGIDGQDGQNGTNGTNGINGINGADGQDGNDGVDGTQVTCATENGATTIYGDGVALCTITGGTSSIELGGGTASANADGSFTINLTDTAGASTSITIPAPLTPSVITCETITDSDGCSTYESLKIDGVEICKLQPYQAKEQLCQKFCADNLIGELTYQSEYETVVTWEQGVSETIPANTAAIYEYTTEYSGPVYVCFTDVCLSAEETRYSIFSMSPELDCC